MRREFKMADYMTFNEQDFLCHYGVLGMKWGIRRYQNPDGSLTTEGIQRYGSKMGLAKRIQDENKKAAKLERDWLVKDYAVKRATKRLSKTSEKLERLQKKNRDKPISKKEEKLMNRAIEEGLSEALLKSEAKSSKQKAEEHYNALVNEFGKENVAKLSDNAIRRGDAIVASAFAGGIGATAITALILNLDEPNSSYYGVRSDAKRIEKQYNESVKGSSNVQFSYQQDKKRAKGVTQIQSKQQTSEPEPEPTYKTVSNGKSKARIESSGNAAEDKKVANNISSINKNATKRWVDDNFERLQKRYPDKSKSELYNSLEVDTVNSNGIVSLKPKTGKGLDDIGYPYVEMDRKTGKMYRGGWDD